MLTLFVSTFTDRRTFSVNASFYSGIISIYSGIISKYTYLAYAIFVQCLLGFRFYSDNLKNIDWLELFLFFCTVLALKCKISHFTLKFSPDSERSGKATRR